MFTIYYIKNNRIDTIKCVSYAACKNEYYYLLAHKAEIICIKNPYGEVIDIKAL